MKPAKFDASRWLVDCILRASVELGYEKRISLSAQHLENLSKVANESQSSRCSSTEYTTMGGVTVLCGDKGYMFHKGSNVAKKIDAWIQKELRDATIPRLHSCEQRKQRVQYLHETERKQD